MTTRVERCPTCGGDVVARCGGGGADGESPCTLYYEPVGSQQDEQWVYAVRRALQRYYLALDRREHGATAKERAFNEIQTVMGMQYEPGKMLATLEKNPGMRQIYDR